jgi:hypothetical protein
MADLTLRKTKGSSLTFDEMDGNFEYFTGSYASASYVPGVLVFDTTITPNDVSGTLFYSSSGIFYFENQYI